MNSLKPGDLVRLKSGGPAMTVEEIGEKETVCAWFGDDNGEYHRRHIGNVLLTPVNPATQPGSVSPRR